MCDPEALLPLPQSKVSYHLGILRQAPFFALGGAFLTELFTQLLAFIHQNHSLC
ncbi:hypothetical protein ACFFLM_05820 [Deinococcus oregonensis]|uniref:Uncharacterized protein n=1 Tax=Deinococcus oregonensis TaxID=1805970 RepID=A0ABV6AVG6_9DEIO